MTTSSTTITTPGLLWVASQITQPTRLSEEHLCTWYEIQHIQEVVDLSGIPAAARYERIPLNALSGPAIPTTAVNTAVDASTVEEEPPWLISAKWLTLYEMNDVEFRKTPEFLGLDGQSKPKDNLQETIFELAKFSTRFGKLVQLDETPSAKNKGPASLAISATMNPSSPENSAEIDRWYREEHVPLLSKIPGYVRTRRYQYVDTTILDEFVRKDAGAVQVGSWLAVHEFEGEYFPMEEIMKTDETEMTKRVLENVGSSEAGFFRLKRVYGEFLGGGNGSAKL